MQTLEQSLSGLIKKGLISREEAFFKCNKNNVLSSLLEAEDSKIEQ